MTIIPDSAFLPIHCSCWVETAEIEKIDLNLSISRHISKAVDVQSIPPTYLELVAIEETIRVARDKHKAFLRDHPCVLQPCLFYWMN